MKGTLHIETALRGEITYLKNCYCTQPFKVANITEDKEDQTLRLMLQSSSPGVLEGDEYHIKIAVLKGCSLDVKTQSYQRLFNMVTGASQLLEVDMMEGSAFQYIPHPSVPHESSSYTARNRIYLKEDCKLVWGEVLTCGRKLSGEAFLYSKYQNITEVYMNNRLIIKENLLIQPALIDTQVMGQLEGYTHQASMIVLDPGIHVQSITSSINALLSGEKEITFGITAAPRNGILLRMMGLKAEQLFDCLHSVAALINIKEKNIPLNRI